MKKKLWIRKLSCGHERYTNIAFMMGNYEKPKIGDSCYCRECWKKVKIISVREADKKQTKELQELNSEIKGK